MNRPSQATSLPQRRGAVLALLVPLLFGFFALAAMVIDIGMVRTTQGSMTAACDTAALEALRWRDQLPPGVVPTTPPDAARRGEAAALVGLAFDLGEPVTAGDLAFAPGPQFAITRPTAGADLPADNDASVTPDPTGGVDQSLQPNLANASDGDQVAGTYLPAATSHQEVATANGDGTSTYTRADFTPAAGAAPQPAMLVRLRRVRGNLETAGANSTLWPSLPLLFGRGAALGAPASGYSVRRDGFTVRATGIATAAPVVQVGLPVVLPGDGGAVNVAAGVVPVAIFNSAWSSANDSVLPPAPAAGQGVPQNVTVVGGTIQASTGRIGVLLAPLQAGVSIGDVPATTAVPPTALLRGYMPILDDASGRVIGFGWAQLDTAGVPTLTKLAPAGGSIAPWNASANLQAAWANVAADANLIALTSTVSDPLLAPVGVRATDLPTSPTN